jgi:hypothetical protein
MHDYEPRNIFSADEMGTMPGRKKKSKERLPTLLPCCFHESENLKPLVTGKYAKPI